MAAGVQIGRKESFSLQEAKELLAVVHKITRIHAEKTAPLMAELENNRHSKNTEKTQALELELNTIIINWHEKIRRLGAQSKGLWLVDFDSGDGYFCWKYPEPDILYWHEYTGGYTNRITVQDWLERTDKQEDKFFNLSKNKESFVDFQDHRNE